LGEQTGQRAAGEQEDKHRRETGAKGKGHALHAKHRRCGGKAAMRHPVLFSFVQ
jgi:hypothetical protein